MGSHLYNIKKRGYTISRLVPTHLLLVNEHFRRIRRFKPEDILMITCLKYYVKCNSRNDVIAICAQCVLRRRSAAAMSCQLRPPVHEKYTTHYNLTSFCPSSTPTYAVVPTRCYIYFLRCCYTQLSKPNQANYLPMAGWDTEINPPGNKPTSRKKPFI